MTTCNFPDVPDNVDDSADNCTEMIYERYSFISVPLSFFLSAVHCYYILAYVYALILMIWLKEKLFTEIRRKDATRLVYSVLNSLCAQILAASFALFIATKSHREREAHVLKRMHLSFTMAYFFLYDSFQSYSALFS